jgi:hypothetical protein
LKFFFSLIVFGGTEVPIVYIFPLPPIRGQPTAKCHSQMATHLMTAVHCGLGRLLDSNPGYAVLQSGVATNEPPLLPTNEPPLLPKILPSFSTSFPGKK